MPDRAESNLDQLLVAVAGLLGSGPPTAARTEQLISGNDELLKLARSVAGVRSKQAQAASVPEADKLQALYMAVVSGLKAGAGNEVVAAEGALMSALQTLAADATRQWIAFLPLKSVADRTERLVGELDNVAVRACLAPPLTNASAEFKDIQHRFGAKSLALDEPIDHPSLVMPVTGSVEQAGRRALERFHDVRDASRAASLLATERPYHHAAAGGSESPVWVGVLVVPTDGGPAQVSQQRSADVMLGVDVASISGAHMREWYDKALTLLQANPPGPVAKAAQGSAATRLARSIRIIARTWPQASFDVRYLLYVVALETLIPERDDIAGAFADIGARLLETDPKARGHTGGILKEAYNVRSRFVHDGDLPGGVVTTPSGHKPDQLQALVLEAWSRLAKRYFALVEKKSVTEDQLKLLLDDFRGLSPYRFGASWDEAAAGVTGQ